MWGKKRPMDISTTITVTFPKLTWMKSFKNAIGSFLNRLKTLYWNLEKKE